jgi:hypothetical protein
MIVSLGDNHDIQIAFSVTEGNVFLLQEKEKQPEIEGKVQHFTRQGKPYEYCY